MPPKPDRSSPSGPSSGGTAEALKKALEPDWAALADEFGSLDQQIALLKPAMKRHDVLRKMFQDRYSLSDPAQSFSLPGRKFTVQVGPRNEERQVISIGNVFALLKKDVFLRACSITLKKLEALVTPEQLETLVRKARTGTRPVDVVANTQEKA